MGHAFLVKQSKLKSSRFKFPSLLAFSCEEKDFHLDVKDGNCTIRERFWPIEMCLRDVNRGLTRKERMASHAKQKWSVNQLGTLSTKPKNPFGQFPAPFSTPCYSHQKKKMIDLLQSHFIYREYVSLQIYLSLSLFSFPLSIKSLGMI